MEEHRHKRTATQAAWMHEDYLFVVRFCCGIKGCEWSTVDVAEGCDV